MNKRGASLVEVLILIAVLAALIGVISGNVLQFLNKQNAERIAEQEYQPAPMVLISQGYLTKTMDQYGREIWKIGTQEVKPSEEFCILSDQGSLTFCDDLFGRYPVSILRTDQLYQIYAVEFKRTESSPSRVWIETLWGIKAEQEKK